MSANPNCLLADLLRATDGLNLYMILKESAHPLISGGVATRGARGCGSCALSAHIEYPIGNVAPDANEIKVGLEKESTCVEPHTDFSVRAIREKYGQL